jgi:hypothetical protein
MLSLSKPRLGTRFGNGTSVYRSVPPGSGVGRAIPTNDRFGPRGPRAAIR